MAETPTPTDCAFCHQPGGVPMDVVEIRRLTGDPDARGVAHQRCFFEAQEAQG